MTTPIKNRPPSGHNLSMDMGLTGISYTGTDALPPRLPEPARVVPPEDGAQSQLDAIFRLPTLEDGLLDYVRPHLQNAEILLPEKFAATLATCANLLELEINRAKARKRKTKSRTTNAWWTEEGTEGSSEQDIFNKSAVLQASKDLMSQLEQNCELLSMYRAALVQG